MKYGRVDFSVLTFGVMTIILVVIGFGLIFGYPDKQVPAIICFSIGLFFFLISFVICVTSGLFPKCPKEDV